MEEQPVLTRKQLELLKSLPDDISLNDHRVIKQALIYFNSNPVFRHAFSNVIACGQVKEFFEDEEQIILSLPIHYLQKEGKFDAELSFYIDKNNKINDFKPKVQMFINCANEIFYNMPLNSVEAIEAYRLNPKMEVPDGQKIVYSSYLNRAFFAVNKDTLFVAEFSPKENEALKFTTINGYFSPKSMHYIPEYAPPINDFDIYHHRNGTEIIKTTYCFNRKNELLYKEMSLDIFFTKLREFRKYKIIPQIKGCLVERVETGVANYSEHRNVAPKKLVKPINLTFNELKDFNNCVNQFEKRCAKIEQSKLIPLKYDTEYRKQVKKMKKQYKNNNGKNFSHQNSRHQIMLGRRPINPDQYKRKLTYEEIKQIKADKRDDSVQWKLKHNLPFSTDDYCVEKL